MCDGLSFSSQANEISDRFGVSFKDVPWWSESRPSEKLLTIINTDSGRAIESLRWGFTPSLKWLPQGTNYRVPQEDVFRKKQFSSYARHPRYRCLVIADGFYEWQGLEPGSRIAKLHHFRIRDGVFTIAGIWSPPIRGDSDRTSTCALITTPPNERVATVRNRMPAILQSPAEEVDWLDPDLDGSYIAALLRPLPDEMMAETKVVSQFSLLNNRLTQEHS